MNVACSAAGGRPGGGAYIFVYDFTGDGVNDYLVSEGNYNCIGKPDVFRPNGRAAVEIFVSNGADAPRGFHEVVRGYRILDGRPRRVEVMRDGTACAQGSCVVALRWNPASRGFTAGASAASAPAAASPPASKAPAPGAGVLTAAEVNSQIVGHRVTAVDGGMTWYYYPNGKYDADDGRNARGGRYVVGSDGRLCWTEPSGISGCFQYYRSGGKLQVRRADPDNKFEVGAVTVGRL